ncbi:HlyD family efflux transporter periplasmic adaptor subunit [Shimia haliotis]|uniref:Membrane fusion protein, multidrug efflux system n=1 Tax=Shimia haliotis TaxID=1280847 RepID=A0A1I4HKW1_9RHOB|nr:HlyD family efflux transporter periplasmic adaptor subunit [Shimia haliotis]SFL42869.1 membrane fusion protein, multidrug efflux system [Shimia haliotis]
MMFPIEPLEPTKRYLGWAVFAGTVVAAFVSTWVVLSNLSVNPRSTDAFLAADIANISAGVPGQVSAVHVGENDLVAKGDLLFEIDPSNYELERAQAEANVAAIQAAIREAERTIRAESANAVSAAAEIERATQNLSLAQATVSRLRPLVEQGIASRQSLDEAETAAADAAVSLQIATQTAEAADELVKTTDVLNANLAAAQATLAISEHMLSRTKIIAPFDGKAVGVSIVAGEWVLPDAPVLSLINDASWYTEAFFKETELAEIRHGIPATIWILSNPDQPIHGTVHSVGWGVQTEDALELGSLLPYVPPTTDWVRLAKRYPVHIELEDPLPDFLRVGASATVSLGTP